MLEQLTPRRPSAAAHPPRLVLADDDAFVRMTLQSQLRLEFECVGAGADADEAVDLVARHRPDVVVLDVVMPGGGALAATRKIRDVSPQTATVILSGDEVRNEVIELINSGATAYLRKGIAPDDLVCRLLSAIAAHRITMLTDEEMYWQDSVM